MCWVRRSFNIHERILNDPGGKYGTPLQAASSVGKTDVVKLLLQNNADPNILGQSVL
jgi:ankyrin repeat protein